MARMNVDQALQLLRDAEVDPDILEALDASALRGELREAREQAKTAGERASKLRTSALRGQFEKHGVKLNPKALSIPDDLDEDDADAIKNWLVEAGALEAEPAVPAEVFEAQERVAATSQNATQATTAGVITPADAAQWSAEKFARFQKDHPDEHDALLRGEEVRGVVT